MSGYTVLGGVFPQGGASVFGAQSSPIVEAASLGDSFVANSYATGTAQRHDMRGPWHWMNMALGAPLRFRIAAQQGVIGETSATCLTRVGNITSLTPKPRVCFLATGNNDVNTGVATATAISNIQAIIAALNAAGIVVVYPSLLTRSTYSGAQVTATQDINAALAAASDGKRFIYVDVASLTMDGGTGLPLAGITYDGIHYTTSAAKIVGEAMATALAGKFTRDAPLATASNPGTLTNALMTGTAGTVNLGFTGQNADSWSMTYSGAPTSATTRATAKVARSADVGDWVQLTLSAVVSASAWSGGYQSAAVSFAASGLSEGDWYEIVTECEVDAGASNLFGPVVVLLDNNGASTVQSNFTYFAGMAGATWTGTTRYVIRTPPLQLRADAGADSLIVRLSLAGDGAGVGGISSVGRFGRTTIRKV